MKSRKVLFGMLAGFAAGAVMGILFAPEESSKARKKLLSKGGDYADALKGKFGEFVDSITKKYESTIKEADQLAAKGKNKIDEASKEVKNATA